MGHFLNLARESLLLFFFFFLRLTQCDWISPNTDYSFIKICPKLWNISYFGTKYFFYGLPNVIWGSLTMLSRNAPLKKLTEQFWYKFCTKFRDISLIWL